MRGTSSTTEPRCRIPTYLHSKTDGCDGVHLSLDPGSDLVGLVGELSSEGLVVLLLAELVLEGLVSLGHQGLDLTPLGLDVLEQEQTFLTQDPKRNFLAMG